MNEIIDTLIHQLGGEKFTALAQWTPFQFTPEVLSYLKYPCYGIRAVFTAINENDKKVVLIMYHEGTDLYIINAANNCENPGKVYTDVYYDQLASIIEKETGVKMPEVEFQDVIISDF
jgi:hypothetical protein